ncbi:TIGR04283 family arsenosugar biosynthesis glycosyltransferase [Marinoscillum sp.]|uniref:TIGR04283 family arsenosugar biosynthesis glycosyltransferase n=1 Tax=Marinoscillum sp. TaxID=2024838 RepID=UPI003BA9765B
MNISIIIPTLNEENNIRRLCAFLCNHQANEHFEIIVVDGGSTDGTLDSISDLQKLTIINSPVASRAVQMNLGASKAHFEVLYFVHADVMPPYTFYADLREALAGSQIGSYRYRFDSTKWLLRINGYFTRFSMLWCRGGDQTLFIRRPLFDQLGGFDEYFTVMEDFDLIRRAKKLTHFHIIPKEVIVSARKYERNHYLRVQWANLRAFQMYRNGVKPEVIRHFYKESLKLATY